MPRRITSQYNSNEKTETKQIRPAMTREARENQLISLAEQLVEIRLLNGTASSQEVTHYLKLSAEKEKRNLEVEKLKRENALLEAKVESLKSAAHSEELFENAIKAFTSYRPNNTAGDEEDEQY